MRALTPAQFIRLRNQLAERCGLYLDESRAQQLDRAVAERVELCHIGGPDGYLELLERPGGDEELRRLAELLVNHETLFFRNQAHFRALRSVILPELHERMPAGRPLRFWSAGCSTGEEPYSLAMAVLEVFGSPPERPVRIWATDLSAPALERAQAATYRGRTLSNLTPAQLARFFKQLPGGSYQVAPEVQALVTFQQLNLLDSFPVWTSGLDLIFCQNVTIYFQLATSKRLIERFYDALVEDGYLFLGFSETLWGIFDRLEMVELDGAFAYRKRTKRPERVAPVPPTRGVPAAGPRPARQPAGPAAAPRTLTSGRPVASSAPVAAAAVQHAEISSIIERALELRAEGQQQAALEQLRRVPPDAPQMPAVLALVAWIHADLDQWEQAGAEARRALELDVLQEGAHLLLGVLDMRSGAWVDAAAHLERALYLVPAAPQVSFHLAECYRQLGRREQAAREYRNTLRKLESRAETELIDGVAVGWLRESCKRWLADTALLPSSKVR